MKKLIVGGLLVGMLPCVELAAAEGSSGSIRQRNSSDGDRQSGEGPYESRRFRQEKQASGAGSGGGITGGADPSPGSGESTAGGAQNEGAPASGTGIPTGGGAGGNGLLDLFETDHSTYHGGPMGNIAADHSSDSEFRPHYSTPEPGGYGEVMLVVAGIAIFTMKRLRTI